MCRDFHLNFLIDEIKLNERRKKIIYEGIKLIQALI